MKNMAAMLILPLVTGSQDNKPDWSFQKVIAASVSQKSYAFKVSRYASVGAGDRKPKEADPGSYEGEYVGGTIHVKSKAGEIARKNEGGYGLKSGEWKSLSELVEDDPVLVDLIRFPAPHTLLQRLGGWISKLEADDPASPTRYGGPLTETAIRALLAERWFAGEDESDLQDVSGTATVHFDSSGLVRKLEFELTGKLPPEGGRKAVKKPGGLQSPTKKPGAANAPEQKTATLGATILFENHGGAELRIPEEIKKKLGK